MINAEDNFESDNPPQNSFGKASISKFRYNRIVRLSRNHTVLNHEN